MLRNFAQCPPLFGIVPLSLHVGFRPQNSVHVVLLVPIFQAISTWIQCSYFRVARNEIQRVDFGCAMAVNSNRLDVAQQGSIVVSVLKVYIGVYNR